MRASKIENRFEAIFQQPKTGLRKNGINSLSYKPFLLSWP